MKLATLTLLLSMSVFVSGCRTAPDTHTPAQRARADQPIAWQPWSAEVFVRAAREDRLVLLYMEAVWCHWCHVMDHDTYGDGAVAALVAKGYIPVKVDSDARPDLANRYRRWAWPATIIIAPDGREQVKRKGFVDAPEFAALLEVTWANRHATIKDVEGPVAYAVSPTLDPSTRATLVARHRDSYDTRHSGLRTKKKSLDIDSLDFAMGHGEVRRAKETLDAGLQLIDPVWGGVYQYSHGAVWTNPHYEKLATRQAAVLGLYARASATLGETRYLKAANSIAGYVNTFLSSDDGAFYVSQDADVVQGRKATAYFALNDAERRAVGIPAVDTHRYTRETADVARALVQLHAVTEDEATLARAVKAASWIQTARPLPDGGFAHGSDDAGGPFLADNLAAGRLFLALYEATRATSWLEAAEAAADFITRSFKRVDGPGLPTATRAAAGVILPALRLDENMSAARFAAHRATITGDSRHLVLAKRAMRWLVTPDIALRRMTEPGILTAAEALDRQ
ncbi:MAG: hypothetical protein ACI9MR_002245 [Myxococcota bacterium]|jgi:uncharacterized protein YyaL (SSP411 family)